MEEKKKVKLLGPPCGYIDMLDHFTTEKLKKDQAAGKDFQSTPIRPSAAGSCTRELFYQLMQFHGKAKYDIPLNEPTLHRLFDLGHGIEHHLIKQFALMADVFQIKYKQQVLSFEYLEAKADKAMSQWLEGSIDLVFWSPKWKCVVDVKSKKDRFSASHKSDWDSQTEKLIGMKTVTSISPVTDERTGRVTGCSSFWVEDLDAFLEELNDPFFAGNFKQLNLYANADFIKERGIDHGAIIQYCKNDSRLREIRFKPSLKLYKATVGKFSTAIQAAALGDANAAPQDYMLGSIKCAFCKYAPQCWPEHDAKKDFFASFPKKEWPLDIDRMKRPDVVAAFAEYVALADGEKKKQAVEQRIVKELMDAQVSKVRLETGEIYELKKLKDSIVIRRTKL